MLLHTEVTILSREETPLNDEILGRIDLRKVVTKFHNKECFLHKDATRLLWTFSITSSTNPDEEHTFHLMPEKTIGVVEVLQEIQTFYSLLLRKLSWKQAVEYATYMGLSSPYLIYQFPTKRCDGTVYLFTEYVEGVAAGTLSANVYRHFARLYDNEPYSVDSLRLLEDYQAHKLELKTAPPTTPLEAYRRLSPIARDLTSNEFCVSIINQDAKLSLLKDRELLAFYTDLEVALRYASKMNPEQTVEGSRLQAEIGYEDITVVHQYGDQARVSLQPLIASRLPLGTKKVREYLKDLTAQEFAFVAPNIPKSGSASAVLSFLKPFVEEYRTVGASKLEREHEAKNNLLHQVDLASVGSATAMKATAIFATHLLSSTIGPRVTAFLKAYADTLPQDDTLADTLIEALTLFTRKKSLFWLKGSPVYAEVVLQEAEGKATPEQVLAIIKRVAPEKGLALTVTQWKKVFASPTMETFLNQPLHWWYPLVK